MMMTITTTTIIIIIIIIIINSLNRKQITAYKNNKLHHVPFLLERYLDAISMQARNLGNL